MTKITGVRVLRGLLVLQFLIPSAAVAETGLSIPDWASLFNPNGSTKDIVDGAGAPGSNGVPDYADPPYSGIDATFVGDGISDGVATDMSALSDADRLDETIVFNGTVLTPHDVGNAFVLATTDGQEPANLVLYGAVERLASETDSTFVEFEFTQQPVQALGPNIRLRGGRTVGDLLVRLNLSTGVLSAVELLRWAPAAGYEAVAAITMTAGSDCSGDGQIHLACDPYLATGERNYASQFEPWSDYPRDLADMPVTVGAPNSLLAFGVNVGRLLGVSPDYSSIIVRTPEDIILDNFRNIGHWAPE